MWRWEYIIRNCFLSKQENMARFEADRLCNHLKKAFGGRFAWFYLDPALLEKYGVDLRNTEQVIEALRAIDGVVVAAVIRREKEGFKVSLRSKSRHVSVGRIARRLNGGADAGDAGAENCNINHRDIHCCFSSVFQWRMRSSFERSMYSMTGEPLRRMTA